VSKPHRAVPRRWCVVTEERIRTSALFFAVPVFGSMGFGDVTPTSDLSRIIVMTQVVGGLAFLAVALRIFFAASRMRLVRDGSVPEQSTRSEQPNAAD